MTRIDTRPLGGTGHESSVLALGAIALDYLPQSEADELAERALDAGVNHVDVAPAYGTAEVKLRPTLQEHRDRIFLGCKTKRRTKDGARERLERSLDRLGVDRIDLYQFHAVTDEEELDTIAGPGGALEAFQEARAEGRIDHIGVTSHGRPGVILDAIDRLDPDTVMFPINAAVMGDDEARSGYSAVLERAREAGIGVLGIKAFAREPWPPEDELPPSERPYETWYRPFDTRPEIDDCLEFALSCPDVTAITNAGDPRLVPDILDAAVEFDEGTVDPADATGRGAGTPSPVPADLRGETPAYLHPDVDR